MTFYWAYEDFIVIVILIIYDGGLLLSESEYFLK